MLTIGDIINDTQGLLSNLFKQVLGFKYPGTNTNIICISPNRRVVHRQHYFLDLLLLLGVLDDLPPITKMLPTPFPDTTFFGEIEEASCVYILNDIINKRPITSRAKLKIYCPTDEKLRLFTDLDAMYTEEAEEVAEYTRLTQLELYLIENPQHRVRVYSYNIGTAEEPDIGYIVCSNKRFRARESRLQTRLLTLIPLLYNIPEGTLTYKLFKDAQEIDLADVVTAIESHAKYQEILSTIEQETREQILTILTATNTAGIQQHLDAAQAEYDKYDLQLKNIMAEILKHQQDLYAAEYCKQQQDITKELETLNKCKSIVYTEVCSGKAVLGYIVPALQYSIDTATTVITRNTGIDTIVRGMLKAIFIEQRYTLLLKAAFEVSLRRGVTACAGNINTDPKYQALPNPHLYYYTCLGSYVNRMYDAVQKRDLEQLYSLLAHSTSCINFADGTVIHRFFQMFKEDSAFIDQNCICDKDNNMYTIRDFREIIRREQEQANEDA